MDSDAATSERRHRVTEQRALDLYGILGATPRYRGEIDGDTPNRYERVSVVFPREPLIGLKRGGTGPFDDHVGKRARYHADPTRTQIETLIEQKGGIFPDSVQYQLVDENPDAPTEPKVEFTWETVRKIWAGELGEGDEIPFTYSGYGTVKVDTLEA